MREPWPDTQAWAIADEYQKPPDTVGEVGSGGSEGGEARGAGRGARDRAEPGGKALDIDRGRGRHVLEVRLGQSAVAAAAQAEGAHPLRNRALDPGPPRVATTPLLRREPLPGGPQRLVLGARRQLQVPGPVLGPGAQGPRRAGAAVGLAEHHRDVRRAGVVDLRAPGGGELPLRAAHPLRGPVGLEAVERVGALGLGLPARVRPRRAEQVDPQLLAAAHQQLRVDVGGVHQVLARHQAFPGQAWWIVAVHRASCTVAVVVMAWVTRLTAAPWPASLRWRT